MNDLEALLITIVGGNYVVLDTETTGLDSDSEIVQVAVVSADGEILLDTLVKPTRPIPAGATAIHGITDAMVADAADWADIATLLLALLDGKDVIIYNADYDLRLIAQTCQAHQTPPLPAVPYACAMRGYAEHNGDWDDYHGNFRWVKLDRACRALRIPVIDAHNARGDCLMTLALCQKLAAMAYKGSTK